MSSLAKLTDDVKLEQEESLINPLELWENLGEKPRNKLQLFSESFTVLRGKRFSKIKNRKGDFLFIINGEVEIESIVNSKRDNFSIGYCWTRTGFDLIGEMVLCSGGKDASARAIARKDSNLIQFKKANLLYLLDQEPRIAAKFLEDVVCLLSDQLAIADKRLQIN